VGHRTGRGARADAKTIIPACSFMAFLNCMSVTRATLCPVTACTPTAMTRTRACLRTCTGRHRSMVESNDGRSLLPGRVAAIPMGWYYDIQGAPKRPRSSRRATCHARRPEGRPRIKLFAPDASPFLVLGAPSEIHQLIRVPRWRCSREASTDFRFPTPLNAPKRISPSCSAMASLAALATATDPQAPNER